MSTVKIDKAIDPKWFAELRQTDSEYRMSIVKDVINDIAKLDDKTENSFADNLKKQFKVTGISPNVMILKTKGKNLTGLYSYTSDFPIIHFKHKKLPFALAVSAKLPKLKNKFVSLYENQPDYPIKYLIEPHWSQTLRFSSSSDRQKAVSIALDGILEYNKGKVSSQGQELVANLKKNFDLLGFLPNVLYTRVDGEALDVTFIHPWGQRTLLFQHKNLPCLLMINSSLRWNKSAFEGIKGNEKFKEDYQTAGYTG